MAVAPLVWLADFDPLRRAREPAHPAARAGLDLPAPFKQAHTKFLSHVADLELYIGSVVARRSAKQNKDDERRFEIPVLSVAKSKWSEV